MSFDGKVNASYEKSKLKAEKAVYSNSEGFLAISNNVIIDDIRGTMVADEPIILSINSRQFLVWTKLRKLPLDRFDTVCCSWSLSMATAAQPSL